MRRKSSNSRHHDPRKILRVQGWTFRIAWFALLKFAFRTTKWTAVLIVLAAVGLGIKLGLERALFNNSDFRLQVVDLNPNQAIDENDFIRLTGLDLDANLFRIDVAALTKCLADRPEIEAVQIERHLPGTLEVRVTARTPLAWLACPDAGLPATREVGALVVDRHDWVYPCPARQLESAARLPIIELPTHEGSPIASGTQLRHPELQHCRRLLDAALAADPAAAPWIDTICQVNAWSLRLTTADGIVATFGMGDHARQLRNLLAARSHAQRRDYEIATINLIPKQNVPITVTAEAPLKALPVDEPEPAPAPPKDRHARDLDSILHRD